MKWPLEVTASSVLLIEPPFSGWEKKGTTKPLSGACIDRLLQPPSSWSHWVGRPSFHSTALSAFRECVLRVQRQSRKPSSKLGMRTMLWCAAPAVLRCVPWLPTACITEESCRIAGESGGKARSHGKEGRSELVGLLSRSPSAFMHFAFSGKHS
jgi:hypothetical protein